MMSLKVCTNCTTPYAHTLVICPQCATPEHVWDHQLPDGWQETEGDNRAVLVRSVAASLSDEDIETGAPAPVLERPKDSATAAEWKAYAMKLQPDSAEEIDGMTKADLITTFG